MIKKALHLLYQPYKFLIFAPLLVLFTSFFGFWAVILSITVGARIGTYCGVIWARCLTWFTPMFLKIEGKENIDKKQSYVIVSNHQSQFDILALYGWLGVDFKWIMKKELRKVPVIPRSICPMMHMAAGWPFTSSATGRKRRRSV